ncbi:hypothetical protein [Nonomuraea sp. NPDC049607]|uniref:hypothetical protein n=1 Tax=Nonomuraea sp. NPDC049607 TaxID=3154732 RepID=UPI00341B578E
MKTRVPVGGCSAHPGCWSSPGDAAGFGRASCGSAISVPALTTLVTRTSPPNSHQFQVVVSRLVSAPAVTPATGPDAATTRRPRRRAGSPPAIAIT